MKKWALKLMSLLLVIGLLFAGGCASNTGSGKSVDSTASAVKVFNAGSGNTQQVPEDKFSVKVNLTDKMDDKIHIQTALPVFSGFQAADELNQKINKLTQDGIKQLKDATSDLGDVPGAGSLYFMSFFDYTRNNDLLSVWLTNEEYAGGAHGSHGMNSFTVNMKTGEFYSPLSSIFKDPEKDVQKITDEILKKVNEQKDMFFPEAVQTVKDKKGNYAYYIDGENLIVYFDLYEICPYAAGIPTFEFPLKDLSLKPVLSNQKPLGYVRVNGVPVILQSPVYSGETGDDGVYLPLEETAALLHRTVTNTNGKYLVDGKPVETKTIDGKIYAPLVFFKGTLGDFIIYDDKVLRMFPKADGLIALPKEDGSIVSSSINSSAPSSDEASDSKEMAYLKRFDESSGILVADPIEWVSKNDSARISELKLNADIDFPNGFYIYNPTEDTKTLKLVPEAKVLMLKWNNMRVAEGLQQVTLNQFAQRMKDDALYPYKMTVANGTVSVLQECYVP